MRWTLPFCFLVACSASPSPEPKAAGASEAPSEPAAPPEAEAAPEPEASEEAPPAEPPAAEAAPQEDTQRKILYRVSQGTLSVEVAGMRFDPVVTPIKKKGGWGVRVSMKATSTDGKMHRLLSPENGPLAFAATVEKNGRQVAHHGDTRKGEEEQFVPPDDSLDVVREFPGQKEAPLWGGQSLKLEVGLWGLGAEAEERRPVRKLFVVKMVAGNAKPQPVILPPD